MASDTPPVRLPIDDVRKRLESLPEWQLDSQGERLVRSWKMQDFAAAMKFLNRIAELAEVLGHHPDFHLERYRHLRIEIWTHSVGGLTERDFSLAAQIDALEGTTK